jgi:hypothetical protein
MGTLNIIQLSLPYFRGRGAGRYLIFSSTSGALGIPGLGRKLTPLYMFGEALKAAAVPVGREDVTEC